MSEIIQAVRGMNDVLPDESAAWQVLERAARETFAEYGYREIRVPLLERTELFKRSIGEVTDIVEKEMYTFDDRGGDSLTLRPGGDGRHRARLHQQRPAAQPAPESLVHGADVPLRAPAEGPLPAVPPDRRRGARASPGPTSTPS